MFVSVAADFTCFNCFDRSLVNKAGFAALKPSLVISEKVLRADSQTDEFLLFTAAAYIY